jgi:hypothetical protein
MVKEKTSVDNRKDDTISFFFTYYSINHTTIDQSLDGMHGLQGKAVGVK